MGGRMPEVAENLERPQEYSIFDFYCHLPENADTLCLKVVDIPSFPKITIIKKTNCCNDDDNNAVDQEKWEVDYDGEVGPFFDAITEGKDFDNKKENPLSTGGEGHAEIKDQDGIFFHFRTLVLMQ